MNGQYREGDIVLHKWQLVRKLGEGSFGKVFEAERRDSNTVYKAAIKIITIRCDGKNLDEDLTAGLDAKTIIDQYAQIKDRFEKEIIIMSKLKGFSNVVSYEDHEIIAHADGLGWDIIIRMELLTPITKSSSYLSEEEVIKLGIDICKALELCEKHKIIHRDIKPDNIFISQLGDYKLGDFGIARTLEKTTMNMTQTGTYSYMAPEVAKFGGYDARVDIYSLGIVLYSRLNYNRTPFLPLPPAGLGFNDKEEAVRRRMSGETLPMPACASKRLADVVMKACAYNPRDRYSSPAELRNALEACLKPKEIDNPPPPPQKHLLLKLLAALLLIVVVVFTAKALTGDEKADKKDTSTDIGYVSPVPEVPTPTPTPSPTPAPTPTPMPKLSAERYEGGPRKLSNVKVGKVSASSVLSDPIYGVFPAEAAVDGDLGTSWQEGVQGSGAGESITLFFDGEKEIDVVDFYGGFHLNSYTFGNNYRPKELILTFSDGRTCKVELEDNMAGQSFELSETVKSSFLMIEIDDVHTAGANYADTAISEIMVYEKQS